MRRADRWAQGLLLALLGLVLGTSVVVLVGPRPCPERVQGVPPTRVWSERASEDVSAEEARMTDPGGSVADDTWGSLGP